MNLLIIFILFVYSLLTVNSRHIGKDRLKTGQQIDHDDCLVSTDKRFYLCMQDDGNLVIYKGANAERRSVVWASHTQHKGSYPRRLIMQSDGNLVIYDKHNSPIWASATHGQGAVNAYMVMQSDGNLVIYNSSPITPLWASNTVDSGRLQRYELVDCRNEGSWPRDWTEFEQEVLSLVNKVRSRGASCGGEWKPPVPAIRQNEKLTRSARCHAADMASKGYFSHYNQQGNDIGHRLHAVGYNFRTGSENIAKDQNSPQAAVDSWMNSVSHCRSIMTDYEEIGIGYIGKNYYKDSYIWVQNFGTSF